MSGQGHSCPIALLWQGTIWASMTPPSAARRAKFAPPGKYLIVGRRDDADELVFSVIDDVPPRPKLTTLCRRALYEMGVNDPTVYEFLCMLYANPGGGTQVVLDQNALRRYVHANYA